MSNQNKDVTPEDEARASRFFTVLFVISVCAAAWIWWNNSWQECRKVEFCVPVNQEWKLRNTGHYKSVNGLSKAFDLKGEIELSSGDIIPVEVSSFKDDDWSQSIDISGLSVKGVSVTDYTDPITLHLAFAIPDLSDSIGETGVIRVTGQVMIPIMESGDDIVSRSLGVNGSYSDVIKPVSDESRVLLKPQGYDVPGRISRIWFWLAIAVGVVSLLITIGSRMDDPDDASE